MRKLLILLCFMLLAGCMPSKNVAVENNVKYENFLESIIDNSKQVSINIPFDWDYKMYKIEDQYSYEVYISNPKVAMYDIQFLAVDVSQISEYNIAPSLGIFEEDSYNMIPNQVDFEKGYYGGVGVNAITAKPKFVLNCLVAYKDKNQNDNYVYFIINADYEDFEKKEVNQNEQQS